MQTSFLAGWQVLPPPSVASSVHLQMINALNSLLDRQGQHHPLPHLHRHRHCYHYRQLMDALFDRQGLRLEEGREGPCLLTVVNSTRFVCLFISLFANICQLN